MTQTKTSEIKVITKKLDDACFIEFGTRVVQKKDGGNIYPVYGGGGATFKMDTYNRENCLVVSRFAMSKQCTRFVEGKFYLNDSGLTVRPKNEKELAQEYLDYLLLTLNDTIYSLSRGTAQRNLNVSKFRNLVIKYPDSIELQLHIAKLLSKAENLIAQRRESIRLLDEFLKSTFLEMFGDPIINSKEWPLERLDKISRLERGRFSPRPRNDPSYFNGDYPFIQTGDISKSGNRLNSYTQTLNEKGIKVSKKFNKGTIVIAIVGATIGATAILEIEVYATDSIIGITPKIEFTNSYFLEFNMQFWKPILLKNAPEAARANINLEILNKLPIIAPSIELQTQFAQIVEKTEALKTQYQQSMQELENLYGSLSQRAFRGELTGGDGLKNCAPS